MIRAVLDTNVIISALFWKGAPYRVLQEGLRGAFLILSSQEILDETLDRLVHKFGFPLSDARGLIEVVTLNADIVRTTTHITIVKDDHSDDKIIACAVDGGAHYLVSGDQHLLKVREYQGVTIVNPNTFLKLFQRS